MLNEEEEKEIRDRQWRMLLSMADGNETIAARFRDHLDVVLDRAAEDVSDGRDAVKILSMLLGDMLEDEGIQQRTYSRAQLAIMRDRLVRVHPEEGPNGALTIRLKMGDDDEG